MVMTNDDYGTMMMVMCARPVLDTYLCVILETIINLFICWADERVYMEKKGYVVCVVVSYQIILSSS